LLTVLPLLVSLLPSTSSFQNHLVIHHPHHGKSGTRIKSNIGLAGSSSSGSQGLIKKLATLFDDNGHIPIASSCQKQPSLLFLLLASSYWCGCGSPQLANAASPDQQYHNVAQEQRLTPASSASHSLLVAAYSSQGSGGLPFLSTFQTPGAVPQPTDAKYDDRDTRNRAYDEAFDQDSLDRNAYYAKMALQAREKKMLEFKERRAELGLDGVDSGPRVGDEKVADMASLKKYLLQKDPSTMTPAEFNKFQQLQNKEITQQY
jgi:hypothetical protein